jgi:hypothetical protein
MGYIIGQYSHPRTWRACRSFLSNNDATPSTNIFGIHNEEVGAGPGYLKTIEGNGLLRKKHTSGGQEMLFYQNTPPVNDFLRLVDFNDPYPVDLVGRNVTTSTSSFAIVAGHFVVGAAAGTGGTKPVLTVEWFENIT